MVDSNDLIHYNESKVVMSNPAPTKMYWKWVPNYVEPPGDATSGSEDDEAPVIPSPGNAVSVKKEDESEQASQANKKSKIN